MKQKSTQKYSTNSTEVPTTDKQGFLSIRFEFWAYLKIKTYARITRIIKIDVNRSQIEKRSQNTSQKHYKFKNNQFVISQWTVNQQMMIDHPKNRKRMNHTL